VSVLGIDLHVHSTASDGLYSPADVVRRAALRGLGTIGLADHDTLDGVREAVDAGEVRVIPGCEFSVAAPWGEMHLLGYFLPPDASEINDFLEGQRAKRRERAERMVGKLKQLGSGVEMQDVLRTADGAALGRPHVARTLVQRREAIDVEDAFRRLLGTRRPAYVPKDLAPVAEVTALIRRVGGVSSAAHLKERGSRRTLQRLQALGVDGVEVRHPAHDAATEQRIEGFADELGLLKSGGSDWHGDDAGSGRAGLGDVLVPSGWMESLERVHRQRIQSGESVP